MVPSVPFLPHRDALADLTTALRGASCSLLPVVAAALQGFAEARVALRRAVVRDAPESARRGLMAADPLAPLHISQAAADRVLASVPPVLNIPTLTPQFFR